MFLIVGDPNRSRDKLELIRQQMMAEINEGIQIQVKYVDHIEKTKTGKYQFVISKVQFKFRSSTILIVMPNSGILKESGASTTAQFSRPATLLVES